MSIHVNDCPHRSHISRTIALLLVVTVVTLALVSCEDVIIDPVSTPADPTPADPTPADPTPTNIALGNGWVAQNSTTVSRQDVPQPTADSELAIHDVYLVQVIDEQNSVESAFRSADDGAGGDAENYDLVIELVEEYYSYEVTEIWLELIHSNETVVKYGEAIDDDCDAFLESTTYDFGGIPIHVTTECTPKILNECRDFIGDCTHATGAPLQGSPPWRIQALGLCTGSGTLSSRDWEAKRAECLASGDCHPVYDSWMMWEHIFKSAVSGTLSAFHYMCEFGPVPPRPMVPPWAPIVPLGGGVTRTCDERTGDCSFGPPLEQVTVAAAQPGGGQTVASTGTSGARLSQCVRRPGQEFPTKNGQTCLRSQGCQC